GASLASNSSIRGLQLIRTRELLMGAPSGWLTYKYLESDGMIVGETNLLVRSLQEDFLGLLFAASVRTGSVAVQSCGLGQFPLGAKGVAPSVVQVCVVRSKLDGISQGLYRRERNGEVKADMRK